MTSMCFVVASILFWFIELLQTDSVSDCFAHHQTNIKHTDTLKKNVLADENRQKKKSQFEGTTSKK